MNYIIKVYAILVMLPVFAAAQPSLDSVFLQYNRLINQAELKICDGDFAASNKLYSKAFKLNPEKPFGRDLFAAFHCAMDVKDYKAAGSYLKILMSRGLDSSFIEMSVLSYYTGMEHDTVTNMIGRYPNGGARKDNLNSMMTKLHYRDWNIRSFFPHTNKEGKYLKDTVYKVDARNSDQLYWIVQASGSFPNENEIGNLKNNPLLGTYTDIILLHNIQDYFQNKGSLPFDTLMYKAMFTFDLPTNTFTNLLSWNYLSKKNYTLHYKNTAIIFPLSIVVYTDDWKNGKPYFEKIPDTEEIRIDEERTKLGLCTLKELRKKIYFTYLQRLKSGKYLSFAIGAITSICLWGKEFEQQFKKPNPIYEYVP